MTEPEDSVTVPVSVAPATWARALFIGTTTATKNRTTENATRCPHTRNANIATSRDKYRSCPLTCSICEASYHRAPMLVKLNSRDFGARDLVRSPHIGRRTVAKYWWGQRRLGRMPIAPANSIGSSQRFRNGSIVSAPGVPIADDLRQERRHGSVVDAPPCRPLPFSLTSGVLGLLMAANSV